VQGEKEIKESRLGATRNGDAKGKARSDVGLEQEKVEKGKRSAVSLTYREKQQKTRRRQDLSRTALKREQKG